MGGLGLNRQRFVVDIITYLKRVQSLAVPVDIVIYVVSFQRRIIFNGNYSNQVIVGNRREEIDQDLLLCNSVPSY